MRIPEEKIDEIRRNLDIVDVVSDYVQLRRAGSNFKALSPFTSEKTPSFIVSPEKQIYKCFSTGKGGNVFTFVMEMEKIGFIDAVKMLAPRAGVSLAEFERHSPDAAAPSDPNEEYYNTLTWSAKFFHSAMNLPEGKTCYDYFRERGILPETISAFGLGYAFDDWDKLHHAAQKDGISSEILSELGLIKYTEKGQKYYDAFRARAMFPIFSPGGKVVGFGGRILTGQKDAPKYINSPESKIYEKSKILFAMNFAKDEIRRREEAILVEGYMDVISLHQVGIKNAVASSGTSLTTEQARLLKRYTKNILFIYDGDAAGIKAMMRGIDVLIEEGLHASVLTLPDGNDPDSFVREEGKDTFLSFIKAHRSSFLDFKLQVLENDGGFESPEATTESIRALLESLSKLPDELALEMYLKELSQKLDVGLSTVQKELGKIQNRRRKPSRQPMPSSYPVEAFPEPLPLPEQAPPDEEIVSVAERTFLKAFLESTYHGFTVLEFVDSHKEIFNFRHDWTRLIVDFMLARYEHAKAADSLQNFDLPNELNYLDDEAARNFISSLLVDESVSEKWPTDSPSMYARRCLSAFLDATGKLILSRYTEQRHAAMQEMEQTADPAKQEEILHRLNSLRKEELQAKKNFAEAVKTIVS
ncbi:DNA primase [Chloroherpeton thalassium ATCC 35110]|uniref:DNA primase n=1 Tax=Chloroherpeton thalassium (strain ATCC 35110 / GB-78) TaxID=517418 RepID=B3QW33_CHLT3|nr:DNA primase [Chloroherpeton thalassium]ACF14687.1 DNA primase [Chloroherpeton thalassium ATCC 35110]